jgi:hypothetical protein
LLFLTDILSAPTAESLKVEAEDAVVSRAVRRASNVGKIVREASVATLESLRHKAVPIKQRKLSEFKADLQTTRVVPEATAEAYALARTSTSELLVRTRQTLALDQRKRKELRSSSTVFQQKVKLDKMRRHLKLKANPEMEHGNGKARSICSLDGDVDELFLQLSVDIIEQRRLLKRHKQEAFDDMWGIDPTGEFYRNERKTLWCLGQPTNIEDMIKKQLKFVHSQSRIKYEKLRLASDVQTGTEILHCFILDILGRDTAVAKIFEAKTEEDFRHSYVLTRNVKALAWLTVVLLNIFFVYFTLLRGLERGLDWQKSFLFACIIQIIVEVTFYETSECALVHFFIPDLARNEVRTVNFALHQAIQRVCSAAFTSNDVLDAPRYLFLSTNLARKFPNLLESAIVQAYHTYSPGMIGQDWKFLNASMFSSYSPWGRSRARMKRFTLAAALIAVLQRLGAASPAGQRLLIHSLQPMAMSGIAFLWLFLWRHPVYFSAFGIMVLVVGVHYIWKKLNEWGSDANNISANVHPSSEDAIKEPAAFHRGVEQPSIEDDASESKREELHVQLANGEARSNRAGGDNESDTSSDELNERIAMRLMHGRDFVWEISDDEEGDEKSVQIPATASFPFDNFEPSDSSSSDFSSGCDGEGENSSGCDYADFMKNVQNAYDKHSEDESEDLDNEKIEERGGDNRDTATERGGGDLCVEVRSPEGSLVL